MTTTIIPFDSEFLRASSAAMDSVNAVPVNSATVKFFDLRGDELRAVGVQDEFDIDEFIDGQDAEVRSQVAKAGTWVAKNVYPEETTLATLRLKAGLSQKEFAILCGIQQPHVSRYETGKHEPGVFQAQAMAKALGIGLDDLVVALRQSIEVPK